MGIFNWLSKLFQDKPSPPPTTPAPTPDPAPSGDTTSQLLALHNAQRRSLGRDALVLDSRLTTAALQHAGAMASANNLSHSLQGRSVGDRIVAQGYRYRTAGENIARGQRTVAQVMHGWMNSPGHRANIVKQEYTHVGFGMATNSRTGPYWCAVFASPMSIQRNSGKPSTPFETMLQREVAITPPGLDAT